MTKRSVTLFAEPVYWFVPLLSSLISRCTHCTPSGAVLLCTTSSGGGARTGLGISGRWPALVHRLNSFSMLAFATRCCWAPDSWIVFLRKSSVELAWPLFDPSFHSISLCLNIRTELPKKQKTNVEQHYDLNAELEPKHPQLQFLCSDAGLAFSVLSILSNVSMLPLELLKAIYSRRDFFQPLQVMQGKLLPVHCAYTLLLLQFTKHLEILVIMKPSNF